MVLWHAGDVASTVLYPPPSNALSDQQRRERRRQLYYQNNDTTSGMIFICISIIRSSHARGAFTLVGREPSYSGILEHAIHWVQCGVAISVSVIRLGSDLHQDMSHIDQPMPYHILDMAQPGRACDVHVPEVLEQEIYTSKAAMASHLSS